MTEARIFNSYRAEAGYAQEIQRNAVEGDTTDYGLFGSGWAIGSITTVTADPAFQIQNTTGGLVVCFPAGPNGGSCRSGSPRE